MPDAGVPDVFGTAGLRSAVLASWVASPARFREDANAEEDLALGGYRDRVAVELAQNAADAAARAGVEGRLLLRLHGDVLLAANTGAALDAAGVQALSTLRASAKRSGETVGRFGVGFASVLAVSDTPIVGSRSTGALRWSRDDALAAVSAVATTGSQLAAEIGTRGSGVPVLRLPWPAEVDVPAGYDTAVVLPLRDSAAAAVVGRLLDEVDESLLLALPALREITLDVGGRLRELSAEPHEDGVVTTRDGTPTSWTLVRRTTELDPAVLADRPTEERGRVTASVTWALPDPARPLPGVILAPTPTDEPLALPALLIASMPVEPSRRRTAPGPLRDAVADLAGTAYAELVALVAARTPRAALALLPGPVGAGEVDARIRSAADAVLPGLRVVPAADGARPLAPMRTVLVDDAPAEVLPLLAQVVEGVADAAAGPVAGLLERLGARRMRLEEGIDALGVRSGTLWPELYAALSTASPESLGRLPVPLADGRVVRGARGTVLLGVTPETDLAALRVLGIRVVDPVAEHPLLERLGALRASPAALLEGPEVQAAVRSLDLRDDDEVREVVDAVLTLVAADPGRARDGDLAGLLLPDDHGELVPAAQLVFAGTEFAELVDPDLLAPVSSELRNLWGDEVLRAVGVLAGFPVVVVHDLVLDPDDLEIELDDSADWAEDVAPESASGLPGRAPEAVLVGELDAVDERFWAGALALLGRPPYRDAVVAPTRVVEATGSAVEVPSYAAWWLRRHARVDGRRLDAYALGADPLLACLFDPLPLALDAGFAAAVGVRRELAELVTDPDGVRDLLDRLAEPERIVTRGQLRSLYAVLASSGVEPNGLPADVRVLSGTSSTTVVPAERAVVVDRPDLLPLVGELGIVVVPRSRSAALADVLQLALASEELVPQPPRGGTRRTVPSLPAGVLDRGPVTWVEHEDIVVEGVRLEWLVVDGIVHATGHRGLARGLAWVADAWSRRGLLVELLERPDSAPSLLVEGELDEGE